MVCSRDFQSQISALHDGPIHYGEREFVVFDGRQERGVAGKIGLQIRNFALRRRLVDGLVAVDKDYVVGPDVDPAA